MVRPDWLGGIGGRFCLIQKQNRVSSDHLTYIFLEFFIFFEDFIILSQLLAMDASARVTMKDAAKCDKRREWQNSENQENAERILHF